VAMYTVDPLDEVLNFEGVPGHSPGAPMPQILASDVSLLLACETAPGGEEYAIVKFVWPRAQSLLSNRVSNAAISSGVLLIIAELQLQSATGR
jgi:hypothetical protein